jgi:hypothetical protein
MAVVGLHGILVPPVAELLLHLDNMRYVFDKDIYFSRSVCLLLQMHINLVDTLLLLVR